MEYLDIVDERGLPTGRKEPRAKVHAEGLPHRTAHLWLVRQKNGRTEILLQKRSSTKDSFPGKLDTSSAGHIPAGDEPQDSVLRELVEELGVSARPEDLEFAGNYRIITHTEFYGKPFNDNEYVFVYVLRRDIPVSEMTLQPEELDGAGWYGLDDTISAVRAHNPAYCVPIGGLELLYGYLTAHPAESGL